MNRRTQYALIKNSTFFDGNWYKSRYHLDEKVDPVDHYLNIGWCLGYNPSVYFSTLFYLNNSPDVVQENINPLVHYEKFGKEEKREIQSVRYAHIRPYDRIVKSRMLVTPESKRKERLSIDEMIEYLSKYDVISFDIFDTLVLRRVDKPVDVFRITEMITQIDKFSQYRAQAEQEARRIRDAAMVNIFDIYEVLGRYCAIPSVEEMARLELTVEKKICYANPYMKRVYEALLEMGKEIIINSDMYFPQQMMEELLEACGYRNYTGLFVSCDYGMEKTSGQLQRFSVQNMPQSFSIIHIGDNLYGDYYGSLSAGWDAYHYQSCADYGKNLRFSDKHGIIQSVYCGIVNNHLYNGSEIYSKEYEHGFLYGGIMVAAFCQWLNRLADARYYDALWFLARDMNIVSDAYRRYFQKHNNHYVVASRSSAMELTFDLDIENFVAMYIKNRMYSGTSKIKDTLLETHLEALYPCLDEFNLKEDDLITKDNYEMIREMIYQKRNLVSESFQNARRGGRAYFDSFLGNDRNICLVDLGWGATIPLQLRTFFREQYGDRIHLEAAMMACNSSASARDLMANDFLHGFLFSGHYNSDSSFNFTNPEGNAQVMLMEALFTSDAPTLLRYDCDEEGMPKLIFGQKTEESYLVEEQRKGVLDFCEQYAAFFDQFPDLIKVSGEDAFLPYLEVVDDYDYFYMLYSKVREYADGLPRSIEGKELTTIGNIMINRDMV